MRLRTVLVAIFVTTILAGAVVLGLTMNAGPNGTLTERWTSDTARSILGNHHAPTAGRIDGEGFVYAPTSGRMGTQECKLVAMDATNASERWHYQVPPANCTIHSVADPTIADYDGDGTPEVLATTTEETVDAFDPLTGDQEFEANLSDYGYTQPIVTDLTGNESKEIVVVDVQGKVFVLRPDGSTAWSKNLSSYTNAQPAVDDFDADGANELAVGLVGDGNVYLLNGNGSQEWKLAAPFDSSITWMTTGQADSDDPIEVITATDRGVVAAIDGASGDIEWRQNFGSYAAVHAMGDGDSDGVPEVYAVAKDGKLRSLNASDGTIEWETTLTSADVPMTPPPSMGDVDGDGKPELVAVTNNGLVSVVDPKSGEITATYEREGEVPIYVHPTLADTNDDGAEEIYVIYGDARVVSLSYHQQT